jgi:hypothetical protein
LVVISHSMALYSVAAGVCPFGLDQYPLTVYQREWNNSVKSFSGRPHETLEAIGKGVQMKPTVGRIVHFVPIGESAAHQAALIVHVHSDSMVNLVAWNAGGIQGSYRSVKFDEAGTAQGSWHWPEREGA